MNNEDFILYAKNPTLITKPKIVKYSGYCIRDFEFSPNFVLENHAELPPYAEEENLVSCTEVEDNFDIQITKFGKFVLKFNVSPAYCGNINGPKGTTRRKIEQDARVTIKLPKVGEYGELSITGENERDVMLAKNRIDLVLWKAKDRHEITHFLSIPMTSNTIKENFDVFKNKLLKGVMIRGLDESLFQNPNKLHLTISTLVLVDKFEEEEAIKVLKQCKNNIRSKFDLKEPIKILLSGLEIMNDDPSNVDVLYGKVLVEPPKYSQSFQDLMDSIVDCFANKGLIRRQYEKVKLHVTLINSLFRKKATDDQNTKEDKTKQKRETFDATPILEKYKNFTFGNINLDFIHLSVIFTTSENNYYEALTTIGLK